MPEALKALGWDHPRCMKPMRAAAQSFANERPGSTIDWETRPLSSFNDTPISELVDNFDLLMIDHPFVGTAAHESVLVPIEELLPTESLNEVLEDDVGGSQRSYLWDNQHWALAVDAACQVSGARSDLMSELGRSTPHSWSGVLELARAYPGRVLWPLYHTDAICSFLTIHATRGHRINEAEPMLDVGQAEATLQIMFELLPFLHAASLQSNPPHALDLTASTSTVLYIPLAFGYAIFAQPADRHTPVTFGRVPSCDGPGTALLGGAGLAVSSRSRQLGRCSEFLDWLITPEQQRAITANAGQPGRRSIWQTSAGQAQSGGFFDQTLPLMENSFMRPRNLWWPPFQEEAGMLLHDALSSSLGPKVTAVAMDRLLRRHLASASHRPN